MPIITLTTDFGLKDGFIGVLKGVIWGICPEAQIADITHSITPQNVLEGAFALLRAAPFFPQGTVHIAVVDPGVGTNRRLMAAKLGTHFFVGPDNGLFTPVIDDAERNCLPMEFIHLVNPDFWLPHISNTFHGRDIFAPVGAHLAKGVLLSTMGTPFSDPVRLVIPKPERTNDGWKAHVTIIDTFGNLTTDLRAEQLEDRTNVSFKLREREVGGMVDSYGRQQPGELVALVDSEAFIEIAIVNGSAAEILGAKVGDVVDVVYR
jgi:S-adenosyl-L-methionine hydrolase (adenosine-forming)